MEMGKRERRVQKNYQTTKKGKRAFIASNSKSPLAFIPLIIVLFAFSSFFFIFALFLAQQKTTIAQIGNSAPLC
jgi:hypothetical protein